MASSAVMRQAKGLKVASLAVTRQAKVSEMASLANTGQAESSEMASFCNPPSMGGSRHPKKNPKLKLKKSRRV